ncbi:type II secretion system secretin GspD [Colwellia sp. UCD-KL20]|uniref:type II secretion system secretin GspD n=1 Tax=Colwellia sp. UCD-KL20 TaxID=1917165 RepID=UPI000970B33B|nr:type II secretion system secretin GspD [Colwellia sp. UCD-KL20]
MRKTFTAPWYKRVITLFTTAILLNILLFCSYVQAAKYSPNFKNTEITEFINIVGKNLNKTMVVDPNVRGKVNLRSYDALTEEQYYQVFLNVLEVYGFSAVKMENNIIKIIRNKDAKTASIPVVGDENPGTGDEMVTRVVEVKNVTVRELVPLLRQLSDQSGGGNVVNYDPANVILLTGTAATVNRLVAVIERVDKAGDQDVQIIKLQYASAGEMVRIIEAMNKSTQGKPGTPTFLIPKIVADDRTNSVIVSGESQARRRIAKLISRLDSELESNGNTRVYYLKYAKAEDLVKVLQGVSKSIESENKTTTKTASRGSQTREVSIDAHDDTNTLVITAEPDMLRSLEAVIRQLDIRRAQVHVEAIIVEVFEADGINLGIQWFSPKAGFTQFTNGPAPLGQIAAGVLAAEPIEGAKGSTVTSESGAITVNPDQPDIDGDYSILGQVLGSASGLVTGILRGDIGAVLQAVSSDTNSNILSTPSITTLDNEEAYFLVGQEIPIITGSATGSNNANPFQTVDRQEVGIKLKVTPQVNEGNAVQLTIEQEVSSVSGATGVDIAINKREIKTTIMADSGSTIVLGGLIDEDVQESEQKVPLLGDIPILGSLFKSTSNTKRKRNLMVFLKASIIRDGETMSNISKEKYNFIRADEMRKQEEGLELMDDSKLPLLPKWNDKLVLPPSFDEYMNNKEEVGPLDIINTSNIEQE